jgi:hypothetical protein
MRLRSVGPLILRAITVTGIAFHCCYAGPITVPVGLAPGTQYRLVFITSTTTEAMSSDISYYNTFVTDVADAVPTLADLGATWTAIASTGSDDAETNIGTGASGIYNLGGQEVALNTDALFVSNLLSPFGYDQNGDLAANDSFGVLVWTGTLPTGASDGGFSLGGDQTQNLAGLASSTSPGVINSAGLVTTSGWLTAGSSYYGDSLPLYAISSELTVSASSSPEPNTTVLIILGAATLIIMRRHRLWHSDLSS